jgi:hypothetical protein
VAAHGGYRPLMGRRLTGRSDTANGFQPVMVRAHRRASARIRFGDDEHACHDGSAGEGRQVKVGNGTAAATGARQAAIGAGGAG